MSTRCGSDDDLEQYALGKLSGQRLEEYEEHLLICLSCQQRQEETDSYVAAIREAARRFDGEKDSRQPDSTHEKRSLLSSLLGWPPLWVAAPALAMLAIWFGPSLRSPDLEARHVHLAAVRGSEETLARVPTGTPLALRIDFSGLPSLETYLVEMVDASGRSVTRQPVRRQDVAAAVRFPGVPQGTYWVRIHEGPARGELLREFGLRADSR